MQGMSVPVLLGSCQCSNHLGGYVGVPSNGFATSVSERERRMKEYSISFN